MANLTYQNIVDIINGGGVVFLDCGGVPKLIDSIPDIPPDLTICGFVERNLSEYIIVGSPANGQIPAYNSTTSKLQWTTPASGGGAWGTITGTLSNQTDLQTALNLKASINTTDGILPYKSGSGTLADSPITRIDASTIQVAAINGGSGANDDITIQGTSNATRTTSYVNLQPNGGNVGIGTTTPTTKLSVVGAMDLSSATPNFRHFYNVLQADLSTLTGTLVLTAPVGRTNTMLHIVIRGFNYFGGGAWEVILGGYNHSSGWLSTSAIIQGSAPFSNVRFGYNGTNDVILLGTTTTAWSSNNKIEITDIIATVSNTTVWGTGWTAAIVASEAAYSSIVGSDTVQRPTFITQSNLPTSIPATNSGTAELLTIGASNIGVQLGAVNLSGNYYGYIRGGNFNVANLAYPLLISPNGQPVSVGHANAAGAQLDVRPSSSATIGAIVQGASGQTANLQEWRNSSGTVLSYVKANGSLVATASAVGQGLELVSTVSGNAGTLTISPKSTAVGSPPDFEIANTGRLFISAYATLLTGAGGVSITGPLSGGNATFTGLTINTTDLSLLSGSNTVDKFLRLGGGKTAFILEKVGSWLRDDFHIALDDAADLNPADLTNVKFTIKNLTGNVGIGTTSPDAQLSIYSQSPTRAGLKVNMPSGTSSSQEVFGAYNNELVTSRINAGGQIFARNSVFIEDASSQPQIQLHNTGIYLNNAASLVWWSTSNLSTGIGDLYLYRDAANTLAQRNGTNAQAFRVYNTYTDASNYSRLNLAYDGVNAWQIITANAGTGAATNLDFGNNNSAKWRINTSGNFLAIADNTYDIGAVGTTRPRNIYVGSNIFTGAAGNIGFDGRTLLSSGNNGLMLITNNAGTDFGRLQFGGTSSSFPSIKRNGTDIDIRLADDTGYAGLTASKLVTSAANSNTTPVIQVNSSSAGLGTGTNGDLALFSAGALTLSSNSSAVVSCVNGLAFATAYGAAVRGGFTMPANSVIGLRASNGGSAPSTTVGATLHAIPDSPTQLTADQDNYQAGTGRSMFYRLSSDASRSITGFNPAGGTNQDGELHYFINVGSNNIVLVNESASSTAGNRFLNVTGADITLATNEMAMLVYDNTSARWRVAKM